jgi:hypothetical protein
MTGDKQSRANRRNARRSTGPTSERGKNTVRYNSLTHGLRAQTVLLPDEDPQAFEVLRQGLRDHHRPIGEQEGQLVDLIIMYTWRLGRAARVEASILNHYSRKIADLHAARLLESPEADPLAAAVEKAQRDVRVGLTKKIMIEQELTNREPSARDPAPDDGDTVPPSPEGPSETEVSKITGHRRMAARRCRRPSGRCSR